jgi:hypothetical protein
LIPGREGFDLIVKLAESRGRMSIRIAKEEQFKIVGKAAGTFFMAWKGAGEYNLALKTIGAKK